MTDKEKLLLNLICQRAWVEGDFTLKSGAKSTYYLDCRRVTMGSFGSLLAGHVVRERIAGLYPQAVGGPASAAISLVAATAISFGLESNQPVEGFFTRSEAKEHGLQRFLEGRVSPGQRAVIVEDVVTSGGSTLGSVKTALDEGLDVVGITCLVDREAQGAENIAKFAAETGVKIQYLPIFTLTQIKEARAEIQKFM